MRGLLPLLLVACSHAPPPSPPAPPEPRKPIPTAPGITETEVKPGIFMTMWRTQVPLSGRAWLRAFSTNGRFSVELPLPFNDFRIRVKAKDGVDVYSDIVGGKTQGGLAWSATCVARADGTAGPGEADVKNETKSVGDPIRAWQRYVLVDHTICVLVVDAQGTDPLPPDDQIQRFLGSFIKR